MQLPEICFHFDLQKKLISSSRGRKDMLEYLQTMTAKISRARGN